MVLGDRIRFSVEAEFKPFSSVMIKRLEQGLRLDSTLEELALHDASIDIERLGIELRQLFEAHPLLPGVLLTQKGRFYSMVSRRRFYEQMSQPFGLALFTKRPIRILDECARVEILILPGQTSIFLATQQSLNRSPELLYEPIVVALNEQEYRLLDVHQLLLAQSDIHELAQSQVAWQLRHDALTGLVNRREFEHRLEQACYHAKTLNEEHVLCYLDLDRFKIVNDTCGHLAGDELLCQVSQVLKSQVRRSDVVARLGGDEFGLLLHDCSLEQGNLIAETIRLKIQQFRFVSQNNIFTIGVSVGLVVITSETQSATSALSQADAACYWAKKQGRDRVQIFQIDCCPISHKQDINWIKQITGALEKHQFRLYRQPIASIKAESTHIEHYEILLRLLDDSNNLLLPGAFLPIAERYNLMPAIDRWVIHHLFANYDRYLRHPQQEPPCVYTINLSGASLNDDQFIHFVREQFEQYRIPPHTICFEITETVAIANLTKAAQVIQYLKQLGCQFALDDFGSGMSSFGYLKNLPVDYLKIDGSFVREVLADSIACAIVEAINHIGQVMGIRTVVEWVDSEPLLQKLKAIGVDYAQGYVIGKPVPLL